MKLIIVDDEGHRTVVPFVKQEITIGRQEGNTIRLTERNVSRHHARLTRQNGAIIVEDLGSYNGVEVNGERIEGTAPLHGGDRLQIGDYQLALDDDSVQAPDRKTTRDLEKPALAISAAVPLRSAASPGAGEIRSDVPARPAEAALLAPVAAIAFETERRHAKAAREPRSPVELAAGKAPRLRVLNTDLAGREFPCVRTDLKIGSSGENDIVIDHASLSRTHARLMRDGSGEWQIVDLESSNGMLVNGEAFGKARLRDGDLLEFGEVKLKFVAPAQSDDALGSADAMSSPSTRRRWLFAASALLLIAGGVWLAGSSGRPLTTQKPPTAAKELLAAAPAAANELPAAAPAAVNELPAAAPAALDAPAQSQSEAAKERASPRPARQESIPAPASSTAQLSPKLRLAREAMTRRDFQRAVDILDSIRSADGSRPDAVDDPLYRASSELAAKKKLFLAQRSLAAGKLPETFRLLEESSVTVAFAKEHQKLKIRAEAARRLASRKKDKDVKLVQTGKRSSPQEGALAPPDENARKLYEEGTNLYRKGQFTDAAGTLSECLRVDPTFAKCHMVLGSTYAKLKEPDLGAQHYRQFVQLAPNDPDAAKVKTFLKQYDSAMAPGR